MHFPNASSPALSSGFLEDTVIRKDEDGEGQEVSGILEIWTAENQKHN